MVEIGRCDGMEMNMKNTEYWMNGWWKAWLHAVWVGQNRWHGVSRANTSLTPDKVIARICYNATESLMSLQCNYPWLISAT
jgi:hypothetical protein